MFGLSVKVDVDTKRLQRAADRGAYRSFSHAAASIRKAAVASIEQVEGPSEPGEPPHTHRRMFLRRSIAFAANKEGAVIGPQYSMVGESGHPHEFGGAYKGVTYPARPFMRPALEANLSRFASSWSGSISDT